MNYIQKIIKIRERGQLTVPQEIIKALAWPKKDLLVKVETMKAGFKVERLPMAHPQNSRRRLDDSDWREIFKSMDEIRHSGKRKVNLAKVLRQDRDSHL